MTHVYAFAIGVLSMLLVLVLGLSFWAGLILGALIVTAVHAIREGGA